MGAVLWGALFEGAFGDLFMLECPHWSVTSMRLHSNFVGVALRHGCSSVDLVVLFGVRFKDSTSGGLLLHTEYLLYIYVHICLYFPSTHLTHYMCVLKHSHFIHLITFSELDDKTLGLLQVLLSLSKFIWLCIYVHAHMHILYAHMYVYACMCVFVCECVCIYIF